MYKVYTEQFTYANERQLYYCLIKIGKIKFKIDKQKTKRKTIFY